MIRFESVRGLYYRIESAPSFAGPYTPGPVAPFRATDTNSGFTMGTQALEKWVRVRSSLTP